MFYLVNQVLIAAGGHGRRMSSSVNTTNSKPLIEYAGQPMLGHLFDVLLETGIESYIVSAGYHNYEIIKDIVKKKKVDAQVLPVSHGGFRRIPYYVQDLLEDQFMFLCGHQPLSRQFLMEMIRTANIYDCAFTSYNNSEYPSGMYLRVLFEGDPNSPQFKRVDTRSERVSHGHKYAINPFLATRQIVKISKEDKFQHHFGQYIFHHWMDGGSVGVVETSMPPEFDYDHEFERTKKFLDDVQQNVLTR